jgi:hypothetical protein
LSPPWKKRGE